MSDPGWPRAEADASSSPAQNAKTPLNVGSFESDFAELAAKFAVHGGDRFPADLSADLALEIVLNEIVEQACLATGATGAAVIMERDGEMVCRASSGPTAPELGARLDVAWGLSGECIRTGRTQRCDDTQTDPRADAAASERLGVRSALVLPLLAGSGVVGLFEVFSPRAQAFGERDERVLEALVERVMKNLERAAEPLESLLDGSVGESVEETPGSTEDLPVEDPLLPIAESDAEGSEVAAVPDEEESADLVIPDPRRRFDFVGWALGAVVLACTILLVVLIVQRFGGERFGWTRFGWTRASAGRHAARPAFTASPAAVTPTASVSGAKDSSTPGAGAVGSAVPASVPPVLRGQLQSAPAAGSLLVFENGKEVFRMPPAKAVSESGSAAERVVALSPATAESSLIHRVEPDYPEEARDRQLQGDVVLDIHIAQDGAVQGAKLVSGEPLLAGAAIAAVRQWRFQPLVINGAPVEMETRVTLNFELSK